MNIRLFSDTDTNTHVNLPSGKISKNGKRNPIKQQKGMTCTLFAMRRIALFDTTDEKHSSRLEVYKKLKQALNEFGSNHDVLVKIGTQICQDFDIDLEKAILNNKSFTEAYARNFQAQLYCKSPIDLFNKLPSFNKWIVIYDILMETVLAPLMNLKNTNWRPRDGIDALKASLKQNGAHFFMGKFGSWCYNKKPKEFASESTPDRKVFYFEKDAYIGDTRPFTHGIIVDQIKKVKGKEMVFFRDPNYSSAPGQPEKIFMLSYETFVQRLTDRQEYRVARNQCPNEMTFGMVSRSPASLYTAR